KHPAALAACRWLIVHNASSEARRRHEMGQFIVAGNVRHNVPQGPVQTGVPKATLPDRHLFGHELPRPEKDEKGRPKAGRPMKVTLPPPDLPKLEPEMKRGKVLFTTPEEARRWYQGSLAFEERVAGFGLLHANDPALQFCLHAARRSLGDFDGPRKWYESFAA